MMSAAAADPRMEVVQCERDIQSIKAALRQVAGNEKPNSLQVVWTGIEGIEEDGLEVSMQLSSPVEEATLKNIGDINDFSGVETSMATLSVTLKKNGEILGTSEAYDVSKACSLGDAMSPKEEYVTELPLPIVGSSSAEDNAEKPSEEGEKESTSPEEKSEDADTATVKKEDTGEYTEESTEEKQDKVEDETKDDNKEGGDKVEDETKDDSKEGAEEKEESTPPEPKIGSTEVVKPVCTISLRVIFKPSPKDQKEELYELLNKASLRRSQALERHRGQQTAMTKSAGTLTTKKAPAVKSGFLNKKPKKAEDESKWKFLYDKYLGPSSMGRAVIFPIAKNYVIFFAAVVLCHFKGQELALPAPV